MFFGTFSAFKKSILNFLRPSSNSIFDCHSPNGIKIITRLRLGLSQHPEHKFRHNFQDALNPICSSAFKKSILKVKRSSSNSIFNCHSCNGIKLITRLRLDRNHHLQQKFRHNFQDAFNPMWSCEDDIETTIHYLLYCPNYLDERMTLLDNIRDKNDSQEISIIKLLLFGVSSNNDTSNTCILNATIKYNLAIERFIFLNKYLNILSPTSVHTIFNDNRLFSSHNF